MEPLRARPDDDEAALTAHDRRGGSIVTSDDAIGIGTAARDRRKRALGAGLLLLFAASLTGCACVPPPGGCPRALDTVTCPGSSCSVPCTLPASCRFDVTVVWSSQLGCRDTVDYAGCVCSSAGLVSCPTELLPDHFVAPHCIDASAPEDASVVDDAGNDAPTDAAADAG